jgi:hypothetical protein
MSRNPGQEGEIMANEFRVDISGVQDHEKLVHVDSDGDSAIKGLTKTLGDMMAIVGLVEITEENASEVLRRVNWMEGLKGAFMRSEEGPVFFIEDMVRRHIGLRINNGKPMTPREFNLFFARLLLIEEPITPPRLILSAGDIRDMVQSMQRDEPFPVYILDGVRVDIVPGDYSTDKIGLKHSDINEIRVMDN